MYVVQSREEKKLRAKRKQGTLMLLCQLQALLHHLCIMWFWPYRWKTCTLPATGQRRVHSWSVRIDLSLFFIDTIIHR